jgi:hypothetical protein
MKTIVGSKSSAAYEPNEVWVDFKTNVPCSVDVRRGRETYFQTSDTGAGQRYGEDVYYFVVRYGAVEGINSTMRLKHNGMFFDITTIRPDDQYRREMTIEATLQDAVIGKSPLVPAIEEGIPEGWVGEAYDGFVVTASGGTEPYSFDADTAGLPPGLNINPSTGVVSGTPTSDGEWPTALIVTDANGNSASLPGFSIKINPST